MKRLIMGLALLSALYCQAENTLGGVIDITSGTGTKITVDASGRVLVPAIYTAFGGFADVAEPIGDGVQNTWDMVTNATNDLWTGIEADQITMSGDTMVFTYAGHYGGTVAFTGNGLNGQDFEVCIYNVRKAAMEGFCLGVSTTGAANDIPFTMPLHMDVAAGDSLIMQMRCTSGAQTLTVEDGIFTVWYKHD